eukprot:gene18943-22669_t
MTSLRSSIMKGSVHRGGSSLTLTHSCYGASFTSPSSPLTTTPQPTVFSLTPPTNPSSLLGMVGGANSSGATNIFSSGASNLSHTSTIATTNNTTVVTLKSVGPTGTTPTGTSLGNNGYFPTLIETMENRYTPHRFDRNRSDSVAATLNTHIDIENPQITNLIGIVAVSYGFTKRAIFMLIAIRILCFNLFAFSIFLSFLKNKSFYKKTYHPLFLFSFTTFFLTILLEYKSTTTTFILFLYSVIFSCLYSLGCLLVEPEQLVKLLNEVFTEFDRVVDEHGCEKIKTDGDAYVCAGGLTIDHEHHYKAVVDIAIAILKLKVLKNNCLNVEVRLRVGVATGSVIGGVIGCDKFQFDVWGDAIAQAHTLEQTGQPGKIHVVESGLDKLTPGGYDIVESTALKVPTFFIIPHLDPEPIVEPKSADTTPGATNPLLSDVGELNDVSLGATPANTSIDIMDGSQDSLVNHPSSATMTPSESTPRHLKNKLKSKSRELGDILLKPIKDPKSLFRGKRTHESEAEMTDTDREFNKYTKMSRWMVQFRNMVVEREYHRYVINNTLFETKFFLVVGLVLHIVFFIDDLVMKSNPLYNARIVYLVMGLVFAGYFCLSFTKLFRKPIAYQIFFFCLLLMFGVCTILELLRHENPLARSSLTRVCATLFYVNVFHSLNFICVTFLNLFIFSFLLICASFLSPSLPEHLYLTDYIGIITVLVVQICSSYGMKLNMRDAWTIKSKVKLKGLRLQREREKSAKLLENILPLSISEKLLREGKGKGNGMLIAQKYNQVAIMFINIVGFEKIPESQQASMMVANMNHIFSIFDSLLGHYELEKIKTIGTAYMVVAGITATKNPKLFLHNAADMALMAKSIVLHVSKDLLNVQIGISLGPCVAGCIGIQRAKFDVWGDTANISARMQTAAPPGKIQVTKEVSKCLRHAFFLEERGVIPVKGKGEMTTFYLTGKKGSEDDNDTEGLPSHWFEQRLKFSGSYSRDEDNSILKEGSYK